MIRDIWWRRESLIQTISIFLEWYPPPHHPHFQHQWPWSLPLPLFFCRPYGNRVSAKGPIVVVHGPTLYKLFRSYRLLRCISFKPILWRSREALTNAILSWVECFRIYHPSSGAATCGGHIVTLSYTKKLSRGPLNGKKLSRTCVRECGFFLTRYRLVLSLDGQFLLFWAVRFQFLPTSIDANGPRLRQEGASYSFTSSVVNLAIEIKGI